MSKILLAVTIVCFAQIGYGRLVVREAPAVEDGWDRFLSTGRETFEALHRAFLNIADAKTDADLLNKIETRVKDFSTEAQGTITALQAEVKSQSGKAEELVNTFANKVAEITKDLRANHPEWFSGNENIERRLNSVADEVNTLRTKLQKETAELEPKLEGLLKTIYENTVQTANALKQQVESALTQKTK